MKKLLLLTVIIVIKVISTKAIALLNVLLSFVVKGKQFHQKTNKWNEYFLSLDYTFIDKYVKTIYIIATLLSSLLIFFLFKLFKFQYPISLTFIITVICSLISWYRYQKSGKSDIKSKFYELKQSIVSDNLNNDKTA